MSENMETRLMRPPAALATDMGAPDSAARGRTARGSGGKFLPRHLLEQIIRQGRLHLQWRSGRISTFGSAEPQVGTRVTTGATVWRRLLRALDPAVGEGDTDGTLLVKEGRLHDLMDLALVNPKRTGGPGVMPPDAAIRMMSRRRAQHDPVGTVQPNVPHHHDPSETPSDLFQRKKVQDDYDRDQVALLPRSLAVIRGPEVLMAGLTLAAGPAWSQDAGSHQASGGIAAALGVMPAGIVRGHRPGHPERRMHGGPPAGPDAEHIIVALFDNPSGKRIKDGSVTATVSGLGDTDATPITVDPMPVAGIITCGGDIARRGPDTCWIDLQIGRPGSAAKTGIRFSHDLSRNRTRRARPTSRPAPYPVPMRQT